MIAAVRFEDGRLSVLDQTRLPWAEEWLELSSPAAAADAIRRLAVRGAPLIGIVAGCALAVAVARDPGSLEDAASELRSARPTAVNLAWAVDRVAAAARAGGAAAASAEALAIMAEQEAANLAIGSFGAELLSGASRVLTHCNTGALACGGEGGTALAVIAALAGRFSGPGAFSVIACETRPLLQGARLTVWELERMGIPCALCVDGAAAGLIARGEVDAVVVGADRVAANGDVANKVGTYAHALAAHAAGIPFIVAAPESTLDPATPTGADIPIEERDPDEVRHLGSTPTTLPHVPVRNPAFDITPADLITALITERGVRHPTTA